MAKFGPKMADLVLKMAELGPKMVKSGLKMAKLVPKMSKLGPRMARLGPKMAHLGPKMFGPHFQRQEFFARRAPGVFWGSCRGPLGVFTKSIPPDLLQIK